MDCKENRGRDFRFVVDPVSMRKLVMVGGIVDFGLGTVKFRLPKLNKAPESASSGADKPASL